MAGSVSEELARLAQLRDQGVLTAEEFEQQKAAVLRGEHPATPAAEAPGVAKKGMGKGCLIAAVVLVVLVIIAGLIGGSGDGTNAVVPPANQASSATSEGASEAAADAGPSLTMAGYNRLKNGMTFKEVTAIVGEPSQEMSRNEIAGTETVMYMWEGSLGANMNAMFQNGKMVQKAQFGLR